MKISIDTKEDSPEDIRKVVALLSQLSEGSVSRVRSSSNIFDDPSPTVGTSAPVETPAETPTNAFANMFGGETPVTNNEETEESPEEEKQEVPEIMPY